MTILLIRLFLLDDLMSYYKEYDLKTIIPNLTYCSLEALRAYASFQSAVSKRTAPPELVAVRDGFM